MDSTQINILAAIVSAGAAIASVVAAVVFGIRANSIAAAQRRQAAFNAAADWRRDMSAWAAGAIDVLSEAVEFWDSDAEGSRAARLSDCSFRLSSMIDRGRLFLPNVRENEYGVNKPVAYRGFRHHALDPLVAATLVLSTGRTGAFTDGRFALIAMRREFVSAIHQILDPRGFNQQVAEMVKRGNANGSADPTLHGLLPLEGEIPPGAVALLEAPQSLHPGLRDERGFDLNPGQ